MQLAKLSAAFSKPLAQPDLLVVAGEHSGDAHAAEWVSQLKSKRPDLHIYAIGGPLLSKAGARLIFDLTQLSVVGLIEVLKHYRTFKKLLNWTLHWIQLYQPKMVCLIDFPGFNLRLAKSLHDKRLSCKGGGTIKLYYYIAPQIWAWKSKRRFAMEKYLDALGTIFPFEKDCFQDTRLDVSFVGHPFSHKDLPFFYDEKGPLLLLPGSRQAAVKRIFPLLLKSFESLKEGGHAHDALVLYPDEPIKHSLESILRSSKHRGYATHIRLQPFSYTMPKVGLAGALMSSGTASLMVGLAGIPGVIAYKANPITYWMARFLVKIPYLGISNLLLNQAAYPEFLKNSSLHHLEIADAMARFLDEPKKARQQFEHYAQKLRTLLQSDDALSVEDWILKELH